MAAPPLLASLLRAADAPAHEAVRLSRAPLIQTIAPAAIGLIGLSSSALAVAAMRGNGGQAGDALTAILESVLTISPITLVLAAWGTPSSTPQQPSAASQRPGPIAPPRVVAAALGLGFLTAGWVTVGLVPLAAFTALVSSRTGWALDAFGLLVAVAALGSVAMVFARILQAIDSGSGTRMAARLFALSLFGVFVVRAQPWITRLSHGVKLW